jgi:hypothetical protein
MMAGAAAVALWGACGTAAAGNAQTHVMTIRLPGGAVEEIRSTGNVAPQVVVSPERTPTDFGWPVAYFGPNLAFAELDRISAAMNRQMDVMLQNAQTLAAEPGLVTEIDAGKLPSGAQGYSFVSTMSDNGVCGKSVEINSRGDGQKPKVVSKSWGDCGSSHNGAGVNGIAASPGDAPSNVREIRYERRAPAPKVQEASLY